MLHRLVPTALTSLMLALVAGPAIAGVVPVAVPEPATISVLVVAIGGAVIARKLRRK